MQTTSFSLCFLTFLFFCACDSRPSADELADEVIEGMQIEYNEDGITIRSLDLVHKDGNVYTGVAVATDDSDGEKFQLSIEVTVDGDNFIWEAEPIN